MMKRYLETGKIVAVQGLKGEVRVEPWCDSGEFLCEFDTLYFDKGGNSAGDNPFTRAEKYCYNEDQRY